MLIIADVAIAPVIFSGGLLLAPLLLALATLLETVVAWRMKWAEFQVTLRDMFVVNLTSTFVGLVLDVVFVTYIYRCAYVPTSDGQHVVRSCTWAISPWLLYLLLWVCTVGIEGLVLGRFKRQDNRRTWVIAIVVNIVSYVVLLPVYTALLT